MADYPRITGTIAPTPRNRVSGFLADLLELGAKGYDVGSTLQAGGPITEGRLSTPVSDLLGIPELQRTLNRVSYNEPLTTGTGYTTRLRPDTVSAAMTVAPMVGPAAKAGAAGARMTGTALKDLATSDVAYNAAMNAMRRSGGMAELTAYHGTPHKFAPTERNPLGEFRASQIGTGEGAQAYGQGLYLAESRPVAEEYAEVLASPRNQVLGRQGVYIEPSPMGDGTWRLATKAETKMLGRVGDNTIGMTDYDFKNVAAAIRFAKKQGYLAKEEKPLLTEIASEGKYRPVRSASQMEDPLYNQLIASNPGKLYTVDIPDEKIEKMLHWDKPLSQQSKSVQQWLAKHDPDLYHPKGEEYDAKELGQQIYERLANQFGVGKAEEYMRSQGIPGIQYFDAGSRASGGTRNFVVFPGEEKNLTILKRE